MTNKINKCFFDNQGNLHRCDAYREKYPNVKKTKGNFCPFCGAYLKVPAVPTLGEIGIFYDRDDLNRRVMGMLIGFYIVEDDDVQWFPGYEPNQEVYTDKEHPWVSEYGYEAFSNFEPVNHP